MTLTKGLSGILTGAYDYGPELLSKIEQAEGLSLLPSGPIPPNPAELLCSMKMEALIKRLREDFDHIIIDSPPVLPITDPTILSSIVDGVIMVVECEMTTRAALSRACRVIEHAGGKIIGTVLNKVDVRRDGYYGYRYYHGYYTYTNKSYYTEKRATPPISWRRTDRNGGAAARAIPFDSETWTDSSQGERIYGLIDYRWCGIHRLAPGGSSACAGEQVIILDDLSTGSVDNLRHLRANPSLRCFFDSIMDRHLLAELVDESDVVYHLAAAVGVRTDYRKPGAHHRNQRQGDGIGSGSRRQEAQAGVYRLDLRGLWQEQQGAVL